ncbi:nucleoporin-interacting protein [Bacillus sp. DJP31]|uniref:nucleoporin-interacting protein n=1 Tax=Bacillus sp. DJP31 TaxID=3409789 RepID=UPI003BB5567B
MYVSPFASSYDQVDFALAMHRYDLLNMQPHFPGYPYFILGGMLVHRFIEDPSEALAIFNGIIFSSASIPMFLLCKKYVNKVDSFLVTVILQSIVYFNICVTQSMSEGAAIGLLWWYLWSLIKANQSHNVYVKILPLFLFSLLLGVRLSYFPFGVGILLLWWNDWKSKRIHSRRQLVGFIILAILFQFIWIMGVAMSEGSLIGFIKLSYEFTIGHFQDWGGTVVTETEVPFFFRFIKIVFLNILWVGLFSESLFILLLYTFLLVLYLKGNKQKKVDVTFIVLGVAYFLWAFLGQNIDKPRHILPLVNVLGFYFFTSLLLNSVRKKWIYLLLTTLLLSQLSISTMYIKSQATEIPATYQLSYFLSQQKEDVSVYTWEESRIMDYLEVDYKHEKIYSYDYFLQKIHQEKHDTIYVTSHVVNGFKDQGIDVRSNIELVHTFRSNKLFDPVYYTIDLYEWKR